MNVTEVRYETIETHRLQVDDAYQRNIERDMPRLRRDIAMHGFQPTLCGTLTVGRRSDSSNWITDGQRRKFMATCAGIEKLPCMIYRSTGPAMEAELFYQLNKNRKSLTRTELLISVAAAGGINALAIFATLKKYGLTMDAQHTKTYPNIRSADKIELAHQSGVLDAVCSLVKSFENDDPKRRNQAVTSYTIGAVTEFLRQTTKRVVDGFAPPDMDRLKKILHQELMRLPVITPRGGGSLSGAGRYRYMAEHLAAEYNNRLSQKKKVSL